jgi:HEAT repeat protein
MSFLRRLFGGGEKEPPKEAKPPAPRATVVEKATVIETPPVSLTPEGQAKALVGKLSAGDASARRSAARALTKLGAPAVEPLIAALRHSDLKVRRAAARILGRIGDPRAVEPLVSIALGMDPKPLRADADTALLAIGEPALAAIIKGLKRSGVNAPLEAADLLGRMGNPRAVEPLAAALHFVPNYGRSYVVKALGQIGGEQAAEALVEALQYQGDRSSATRWLVRAGETAISPLVAALGDEEKGSAAGSALVKIGAPAVEPLIAALENPDAAVIRAAVGALQKLAADTELEQTLREKASAAAGRVDVPALDAELGKRRPKAKPKPKRKPARKPAPKPTPSLGRGYDLLFIVGEASGETPAYQRALNGLVQQLASAQDGRLAATTQVKTFVGGSLPEPGNKAGIEGFVRMLQIQHGIGLLGFEVEFRQSGGYKFMVAYMRRGGAAELLGQMRAGLEDVKPPAASSDSKGATYRLTQTCLGNPLDLEVTTEELCVYCKHLRDPNLRDPQYPKGVGECSNYGRSEKGVVSFDDTCSHWAPNTKVRFWLSKGYMEHNLEGWPRRPWYRVFDDGPDGEKGTR